MAPKSRGRDPVGPARCGVSALELDALRADLVQEQDELDALVAPLSEAQWLLATPSVGWNVADQIGHLTYFDGSAVNAIVDPERFQTELGDLLEGALAEGLDTFTLGAFRTLSSHQQLAAWRHNRAALAKAVLQLGVDTRVDWYGPSMGSRSFLTARLMEVWAHGTDVADALGVDRPATERLRHVAQLGFITRRWSYKVRGEEPPGGTVRLELSGPTAEIWTWGDDDAADVIRGTAKDFCLVVTQRRHVDDTSLETGELGRHWLLRAQAFAGTPSTGPEPRSIDGAR